MLTLINANRMLPPIGPIGLDYVAGAARRAGFPVDVVDLCLADDPDAALTRYFAAAQPRLVGISFRNVDDCFWPSGESFVPDLARTVRTIRSLTDAPVVIGGVGFSIFSDPVVRQTGADFGVRGDGEQAIVSLLRELQGARRFDRVEGLLWRQGDEIRANPPAWPRELDVPTARDAVDNAAYFRLGGQGGVETKRGCNRTCLYCADPLAKGSANRPRNPVAVADEVESLQAQGVDVLHLCDAEFNLPVHHAHAVCEEFIRRGLGERVRWYAYLAVVPFDAALAEAMRRAGCVGINFTGDSAAPAMLKTYRQPHGRKDIALALRACRDNGIAVMIDLLLGGPGETPETVTDTIHFIRQIGPDCAGAALGLRVYPGTGLAALLEGEAPLEDNAGIRRHYEGPIDLSRPTFYISEALGDRPAALVRDRIAGDPRFFEPQDESATDPTEARSDHNYNCNTPLMQAIAAGARGAYWDILRRLR